MTKTWQHKRKSIIRRRLWTATGFILLVAIVSFLTASMAPRPIVNWLVNTGVPTQTEVWIKRLGQEVPELKQIFRTQTLTYEQEIVFESLAMTTEIAGFEMIDSNGNVFWSIRGIKPGIALNTQEYFDSIKLGKPIVVKIPQLLPEQRKARGIPETARDGFVEIFAPFAPNNQPLGSFHFYSDLSDLHASLEAKISTTLILILGLILAILAGAMIFSLRTARAQAAEYRARRRKEQTQVEKQMQLSREIRLISELNEWLQSSKSLHELFDMVARFMTHLLPECSGSLYIYSNSRDVLDGAVSWNGATHKDHIQPDECWGLRRGRSYFYGQNEVNFTCGHVERTNKNAHQDPYFCFPVLAHGDTVGLLHLSAAEGVSAAAFAANRKLAQMTAEQISMAIANVRMRDQLEDQSIRDPLTGLYNRRHLNETLRRLLRRADLDGLPLGIIALDVDEFKKFNDNHGHDAGDMVLRAVGAALDKNCDGDELACRLGGEEFALILPNSEQSQLLERAEILRDTVSRITVRYGEKTLPGITVSLGVADFPTHGELPQELLKAADEALYQAKAEGRNTIVLAKPAISQKTSSTTPCNDVPQQKKTC
ncbi:MAG: GGDEF domain-containing protein [Rhodobacterales bacterium]|nr:MAG: GGDEF domain-containing protein [Rhodobacterales bacterium]